MGFYSEAAYAANRCAGTVLMNKTKTSLYLVKNVLSLDQFVVNRLNKPNEPGPVYFDDEVLKQDDLTFVTPPLGYALVGMDALYLLRLASRRYYRQGLREDVLGAFQNERYTKVRMDDPRFLYMPMLNMYPSLKEARDMLVVYGKVPLSRSFAIGGDSALYYRGIPDPIGRIGKRTVFYKVQHVRELIKKELIDSGPNVLTLMRKVK